MKNLKNAPRIYVGTYGQYNNGSLFGKWFDLSDYKNLKNFLQDCFEFYRNEFDPELMFQDWENIPDLLISECSCTKMLCKQSAIPLSVCYAVNTRGLLTDSFSSGLGEDLTIYLRSWGHSFSEEYPTASLVDLHRLFLQVAKRE